MSGLRFYNLSQRWGHAMPEWPSVPSLDFHVLQFHARDGVYTMVFDGIMHRGTHMDAPVHVEANRPYMTDYPLWRSLWERERLADAVGVAVPPERSRAAVADAQKVVNATAEWLERKA